MSEIRDKMVSIIKNHSNATNAPGYSTKISDDISKFCQSLTVNSLMSKGPQRRTLLMEAVLMGSKPMVNALLRKIKDIDEDKNNLLNQKAYVQDKSKYPTMQLAPPEPEDKHSDILKHFPIESKKSNDFHKKYFHNPSAAFDNSTSFGWDNPINFTNKKRFTALDLAKGYHRLLLLDEQSSIPDVIDEATLVMRKEGNQHTVYWSKEKNIVSKSLILKENLIKRLSGYSEVLILDRMPQKSDFGSHSKIIIRKNERGLIAYWLKNDEIKGLLLKEEEVRDILEKLKRVEGQSSTDPTLIKTITKRYGCKEGLLTTIVLMYGCGKDTEIIQSLRKNGGKEGKNNFIGGIRSKGKEKVMSDDKDEIETEKRSKHIIANEESEEEEEFLEEVVSEEDEIPHREEIKKAGNHPSKEELRDLAMKAAEKGWEYLLKLLLEAIPHSLVGRLNEREMRLKCLQDQKSLYEFEMEIAQSLIKEVDSILGIDKVSAITLAHIETNLKGLIYKEDQTTKAIIDNDKVEEGTSGTQMPNYLSDSFKVHKEAIQRRYEDSIRLNLDESFNPQLAVIQTKLARSLETTKSFLKKMEKDILTHESIAKELEKKKDEYETKKNQLALSTEPQLPRKEIYQYPCKYISAYNNGSLTSEFSEANLSVNLKDDAGNSLLHIATKSQQEGIIRLLLDRGANPLIMNKNKMSPFSMACQLQDDGRILRIFVEHIQFNIEQSFKIFYLSKNLNLAIAEEQDTIVNFFKLLCELNQIVQEYVTRKLLPSKEAYWFDPYYWFFRFGDRSKEAEDYLRLSIDSGNSLDIYKFNHDADELAQNAKRGIFGVWGKSELHEPIERLLGRATQIIELFSQDKKQYEKKLKKQQEGYVNEIKERKMQQEMEARLKEQMTIKRQDFEIAELNTTIANLKQKCDTMERNEKELREENKKKEEENEKKVEDCMELINKQGNAIATLFSAIKELKEENKSIVESVKAKKESKIEAQSINEQSDSNNEVSEKKFPFTEGKVEDGKGSASFFSFRSSGK
jgi:hypothetical protein